MSFTAPKFTNAGRQLQTRVIAGDTLTFTVIKLGDGTMTTEPIAALTDLIHGIITLPVHEVRRNADYADVTGVFQNAGLSSGFYWREIGIFAADPDYPNDRSHDILYCYQNAAELAEYIPSASSAVIEKIIRVACVVGDAENVTVGLASQAYAKAEDLQALEEQHSKDVERINDALDAIDPTKITAKAEPADADGVLLADSEAAGGLKRLLWSSVKTALGKLFVPLARKVNGKALSSDVTLTGDDIAMGADDAESLRAAMAKRAVWNAVLVSQQSALAWAAAQKEPKQCGFDPHTTDTPYEGYWCAELTLHAPSNQWRVLYVTNVVTLERWFNIYNIDHWIGWRKLSLAVTPEVHNFPLADGYTDLGCKYFRTQENVVSFAGEVMRMSGFRADETFAVLPEGFRPDHTIVVPALLYPSYTPTTIIIKSNGEICETITASDKSLYMQATFVAG